MENDKIITDGTQPEPDKKPETAAYVKNETVAQPAVPNEDEAKKANPLMKFLHFVLILAGSVVVALAIVLFVLYTVPALKELVPHHSKTASGKGDLIKDANYKKQIGSLSKDIQRLSLKYNSYTSGQSYIVINTTDNRFSLYTNKNLVREGSCSTGSYIMLQASTGNKKWVFKTPRGKYWIHGKKTNPVWKRPDWSFVEEGSKIPSANDDSRYEYGVLGDYALTLGDGYMIHGTIYKRFLGMPVTHGCVRLNDEDLKVVYNTLNIGSKVYIF